MESLATWGGGSSRRRLFPRRGPDRRGPSRGIHLYDADEFEDVRFIPTEHWTLGVDLSTDGRILAVGRNIGNGGAMEGEEMRDQGSGMGAERWRAENREGKGRLTTSRRDRPAPIGKRAWSWRSGASGAVG